MFSLSRDYCCCASVISGMFAEISEDVFRWNKLLSASRAGKGKRESFCVLFLCCLRQSVHTLVKSEIIKDFLFLFLVQAFLNIREIVLFV